MIDFHSGENVGDTKLSVGSDAGSNVAPAPIPTHSGQNDRSGEVGPALADQPLPSHV